MINYLSKSLPAASTAEPAVLLPPPVFLKSESFPVSLVSALSQS